MNRRRSACAVLAIVANLIMSRAMPAVACEAADVEECLVAGDYLAAMALAQERIVSWQSPPPVAALPDVDALVRAWLANGRGSEPEALAWAKRGEALAAASADPLAIAAHSKNLALVLLEHRDREPPPEELLARAVASMRSLEEPQQLAEILVDAAQGYVRLEQPESAGPLLAEATALVSDAPDELLLARVLEQRALIEQSRGDFSLMRAPLERALEIRDRRSPAHPETAALHGLFGDFLALEGRLREARVSYEQAVAIMGDRLGSEHPRMAHLLGRLGATLLADGDVAGAVQLHERALAISRAHFGSHHAETFARYNDLANALLAGGDIKGARSLYEQALAGAAQLPEPDQSLYRATLYFNLAETAMEEGDLDLALTDSTLAVDLWSQRFGVDHPFVALGLEELAEVQRRRGELSAALDLLRRALDARRSGLGDMHFATAAAARRLGEVALEVGDLPSAISASRLAQLPMERLQRLVPDEATRISLLAARVAWARGGDRSSAFAGGLKAQAISSDYFREAVRHLAEGDALRLVAARAPALDFVLSMLAAGPASETWRREAFTAVVRSRSLVLDAIAERAHATSLRSSDAGELRERLDQSSRRLANLLYRGPAGALEGFDELVASATSERDRAEREFARESSEFSKELELRQADFAEVVSAIPVGAVLVSLVRFKQMILRSDHVQVSGDAYVAFVSRQSDRAPRLVRLGPAEALDAAVSAWREAVHDAPGALGDPASERRYRSIATALERTLWQPLALGKADTRVFVVSEGSTQLVNFAALPASGGRYLVDTGLEFHSLSAERDLLALREAPATTSGLLAVGAPAFGASASEVASASLAFIVQNDLSLAEQGLSIDTAPNPKAPLFAGRRSTCGREDALTFAELPQSGVEALAVSRLWEHSGAGDANLLVGANASASLLEAFGPGKRVLHIATHGFFLAAEGCSPAGAGKGRENPMLLSGLAFAGANRRRTTDIGADDGILTAEEISRLSLGPVQWVVLSGCDTGRGQIQNGEGVLGLRRSFEVAGARSVISSLWSVDDAYTRDWMAELYSARLDRRLDTPASVSAANRAMLRRLRAEGRTTHPALWGAFVASGDWR